MSEDACAGLMAAEVEGLPPYWRVLEGAPEMRCLPLLAWENLESATIYVACEEGAI